MVSTLSLSVNEKARAAFNALVDQDWTNIVEHYKSNSDTGETCAEELLRLEDTPPSLHNGIWALPSGSRLKYRSTCFIHNEKAERRYLRFLAFCK